MRNDTPTQGDVHGCVKATLGEDVDQHRQGGRPLLDLGTYPVSFLTEIFGVPQRVIGLGQPDPSGVNGLVGGLVLASLLFAMWYRFDCLTHRYRRKVGEAIQEKERVSKRESD